MQTQYLLPVDIEIPYSQPAVNMHLPFNGAMLTVQNPTHRTLYLAHGGFVSLENHDFAVPPGNALVVPVSGQDFSAIFDPSTAAALALAHFTQPAIITFYNELTPGLLIPDFGNFIYSQRLGYTGSVGASATNNVDFFVPDNMMGYLTDYQIRMGTRAAVTSSINLHYYDPDAGSFDTLIKFFSATVVQHFFGPFHFALPAGARLRLELINAEATAWLNNHVSFPIILKWGGGIPGA